MNQHKLAWQLGLVVAAVAALYGYGCHERQIGAAKAAEAAAKADAKVAAESIAALHLQRAALLTAVVGQDRAFQVKQAAITRTVANYQSAIADLTRLLAPKTAADSADTTKARLLGQVRAACDSLAAAAADTMPCHLRVAGRDSVIRADSLEREQHAAREQALERENAAVRKQLPGWFNRTGGTVVKVGGGFLLACVLFGCHR